MSGQYALYSVFGSSGSGGVSSINGQTGAVTINTGTTGVDFNIVTAANVITLELPVADATHTGKLSSVDWSTFNSKQAALTPGSISTSTTGVTVGSGANSTVGPNVTINIATASTSLTGLLTSTDWNTFNNKQNSLTLGNLTDAGTDGIVITGGTGAVVGSGTSIAQHVSDSTHNGYLSSTDWSTFNNKQSALTLGDLTDVGTDGITITGGTGSVVGSGTSISQHVSDATHNGYLSSTDWSTFNSKQAAGNYITALTGDATAAGPGSAALTLATVNGNVGSFGSSTAIPSFTVNAKGLITAASTNAVIAPAGTLTGTTLAATVVSSSLTSLGTITTGVWNGTTIAVANGGTGLATLTANNVILGNGSSSPSFVAPGSSGNVLTSNGTTWTSAAAPGSLPFTIAHARIDSTGTITYQNSTAGNWISSVNKSATGVYDITFNGGIFSVAPTCITTIADTTNANRDCAVTGSPTTTTTTVYIVSSLSIAVDVNFNIIAMG